MSSSSVAGGDWTSFNYDLSNSRYNSKSTITGSNANELHETWNFSTGNYAVTSEPIVQNGVVFFGTWGGDVYALNISNGRVIWTTHEGGSISSSLAVSNGVVYGGRNPTGPVPVVFALNESNGNIIWNVTIRNLPRKEMMPSIWASPIVYKNLVYIGMSGYNAVLNDTSLRGEIVALRAATGKIAWNYTTMIGNSGGAGVWSSVAIDPILNALYFGTGSAYGDTSNTSHAYSIFSLDLSTGRLLWLNQIYLYRDDKDFGSSPNLFLLKNGPEMGIGGKDGNYYVLNRENGKLLKKFTLSTSGDGIIGVPAVLRSNTDNPELFIPANSKLLGVATCSYGNLTALSPNLAPEKAIDWSFPTGCLDGSISLVPGAVMFGDIDIYNSSIGNFYVLATATGKLLYKDQIAAPIASGITSAEGFVLFGAGLPGIAASGDGVYAYSVS
jgi:outer membrane protein assembly factor BamB